MKEAFKDYLKNLESIDNVYTFEIEQNHIETIIDDIFLNMHEVDL
jgi:hypothetical protein